jgi:hypothetical protein
MSAKEANLERLKIPIFMSIEPAVNHNPAHGIFDNVKVIGNLYLRDRLSEVILSIETMWHVRLERRCIHNRLTSLSFRMHVEVRLRGKTENESRYHV